MGQHGNMNLLNNVAILLSVALAFPLPAFANNVPGIQSLSALMLMPLAVVLFSALAGAYHILHRERSNRLLSWAGTVAGCVILIALSAVPELALITVAVFGWRAISRALEMFGWANNLERRGSRTRPSK